MRRIALMVLAALIVVGGVGAGFVQVWHVLGGGPSVGTVISDVIEAVTPSDDDVTPEQQRQNEYAAAADQIQHEKPYNDNQAACVDRHEKLQEQGKGAELYGKDATPQQIDATVTMCAYTQSDRIQDWVGANADPIVGCLMAYRLFEAHMAKGFADAPSSHVAPSTIDWRQAQAGCVALRR